jgi:hypothetical protein
MKNKIGIGSDVKFKNSIETGDPISQTYLKALDFGGNIFAGYEMANGIFLQVNTQIGMVNISPNDNQNPNSEVSIKNIGFGKTRVPVVSFTSTCFGSNLKLW